MVCDHIEGVVCVKCAPSWRSYNSPKSSSIDTGLIAIREDELMDLRLRLQETEHDLEHVVVERDRAVAHSEELVDEIQHLEALLENAEQDRDEALRQLEAMTLTRDVLHNSVIRLVRDMSREAKNGSQA